MTTARLRPMPNRERADFVLLTPKKAQELLDINFNNYRNINRGSVDKWAGAMLRGEWLTTHQGIAIDEDGILLDGQHRCSAVIQSGVSIRILLVTGIAREARDVVDTMQKRIPGDAVRNAGYEPWDKLASLSRRIMTKELGLKYTSITTVQVREFVAGNFEALAPAVEIGQRAKITGMNPTSGMYSCYLFMRIDPEAAMDFFQKLVTAEGISATSPIFALRKKLSSLHPKILKQDEWESCIFQAWNSYRRDGTMQNINPKNRAGKITVSKDLR